MKSYLKKITNPFIHLITIVLMTISFLNSCNNQVEQKPEILPYSEIKKIYRDDLLEWNREVAQTDKLIIEKFIERRKWDMQVSETGLYYDVYYKGNGEQAIEGKYAEFNYSTSLLDGTVLYTSEEYGTRTILIGHNEDENGLDEGLRMMHVGDKARFILHPFIAFGIPGDGYKVPIQAILLYDIELIDVRTKK